MLSRLMILVDMFITWLLISIHDSQASLAKPGCQEVCGNVTIPYPFGVGTGCYFVNSFEVLCTGSSQDHYPLRFANQEYPIVDISIDMVRVVTESTVACNSPTNLSITDGMFLDYHFFFSQDRNLFVGVGCNISATLYKVDSSVTKIGSCESLCNETIPAIASATSCTGFNGCCQHSISEDISSYMTEIYYNTSACAQAVIAENNAPISITEQKIRHIVLSWVVTSTTCHESSKTGDNLCGKNSYCIDSPTGLGYSCRCRQGYEGSPYLPDGCQDERTVINNCPKQSNHYCKEGETCVYTHESYKCISSRRHKPGISAILEVIVGLSAFSVISYCTFLKLVRIRKKKIKKMFFEKNGGQLLKQQISANKSCVMAIKVYTTEEMTKATNNFSRSRIVGKGGQGTVYKGLFSDGTIVAIKKLIVIDVDQVERFINEVLIFAQINHRNIVRLLGCCLEYEVPLLVYEYLANDTLSQHLHDRTTLLEFSWKDRIRITREVAGALAYLHSYASPTVFHRDVKPSNILLDQNYKAVVSDFGLSRSVTISKSHLTTQVEGTFGYLDPEYFESGKLTAKSDVYSFGVVLTELLTGKKSISSSDLGEGLVPRFRYFVKHNRFDEILDKQVLKEAMIDDVVLVAKLANRCMKRNSKKRPSMEDVVVDLDKLRVSQLEVSHQCVI